MAIDRPAARRPVFIALLLCLAMPPERPAGEDGRRVIEVVASRFAFEPAQIDATAGERLRLVIRSADGVHGFGLRSFNVQRTIPRGDEPVIIDLEPTVPGRYPFICSEYCGAGHDDMRGMLVIHARPDAEEPE